MATPVYYYRAFGMNIKSELMLSEVKSCADNMNVDLEIVVGGIPDFKEREKVEHQHYIKYPMIHYFYKKRAGEFYIEQGRRIIIEMDEEWEEGMLHAMLLEWGIGIALQQRECIALHSGGVVYKGQAIIVCGDSGAGKSTIISALMREKMLFLGDDTVVINFKEGQVLAEPTFPQQKFCKDTALAFGYHISKLKLLNEDREKYAVCRLKEFATKPVSIGGMFILEKYDGDEVKIESVQKGEKLRMVLRYLYTQSVYKHIGISASFIKKCAVFAKNIEMYRIQRPIGKNTTAEISRHIKKLITKEEINGAK